MGWFRRIVQWLTGEVEPERAVGVTRAAPPPAAPAAAADPYFTEPSLGKPKTLGLDAGAFLPISRQEIKKAAQDQNLFFNPWFGRRDRIPPADDPRTKLDRPGDGDAGASQP